MATGTTYDFSGKIAFVTGAASGIGRATALAFAEAGAWVALADINEDGGQNTARMIQENGGEALFFKCDLGDSTSIPDVLSNVVKHMGPIDYAFNNAGIEGETGNTVECSESNWQTVINVNLRGIWLCMKNEIPQMLKKGGGAIVNTSSVAGVVGFQGIPAYVASKHGVLGLTKAAALEFATQKIRVNAICPGVIQTPMIDRFTKKDPDARTQLLAGEPMGRLGTPEEIASAVLWLCSDQSSFVTGHSLVVDGGWVAQ